MKVAVIGAGFSGLIWAERLLRQGHAVTVFEKAPTLGGVWRSVANRSSRVQMVAPDYGFWEGPQPAAGAPTDFTPRGEILAEARRFAQRTGVMPRIRFSTAVQRIERDPAGCTLTVDTDGERQIHRFDAVAVLPGTLTRPRRLPLPGAETFRGVVAQGVSDDLDPVRYAGKRVVIVGMGSYAIENAREALLHGAAHVTLVARSYNVVAPKVASLRISNRLVWKGQGVLDTLRAPYEALGRTDLLEKLVDGATLGQRTIPPVSDLFFIAQRFGRLAVIRDEVARAIPTGVQLRSGAALEADVIVGCVGFERTATAARLEGLLGAYSLNGMFVDRMRHVGFNFEPVHGGMDATQGIPFASHLTITRTLADLFVYYLSRPQAFDAVAGQLPSVAEASAFSGSDYQGLFTAVAKADPNARAIIVHHLAAKVARCEARYSERDFIAQNRADWKRLCAAMGGTEADFPYPFVPQGGVGRVLQARLARLSSGWRRRRAFGAGHRAPTPPPADRPASPGVTGRARGVGGG